MYQQDLEMLRLTRAETLRLTAGVDQAQSEFAPAAEKWSVGEVLDHLLLAENYYRGIFGRPACTDGTSTPSPLGGVPSGASADLEQAAGQLLARIENVQPSADDH